MRAGSLEEALVELGMPLTPLGAAVCVDVLLKNDWLCSAKFPVTIRKRLETVEAVSSLQGGGEIKVQVTAPAHGAAVGVGLRPSFLSSSRV